MNTGNRKAWRPRVADGDFFIADRHYHLYAVKRTYTIEECKRSSFTLDKRPMSLASTSVTVEGHTFTDFSVDGKALIINHPDPLEWMRLHGASWDNDRKGIAMAGYAFEPSSAVVVSYSYEYESAPGVLATTSKNETLYIRDAALSYAVPDDGGVLKPVVVTDDCIQPGNKRDFVPEFKVGHDSNELTFNTDDNLLFNPGFCAVPVTGTLKPLGWLPGII
jgi:hypothetical protein